jgi:putative Holliday junction resolvase
MNETCKLDRSAGPILALDLGQKRIGVAVSDALLISIRPLDSLNRTSWKRLLQDVVALTQRFDAQKLVIGLPLMLNGTYGPAAQEIEQSAKKFARSLQIPVFLQDERLTSKAAEEHLRASGFDARDVQKRVDSESAAIILRDYITSGQGGIPVQPR